VHGLRGWNILDHHERDACVDVSDVPGWFQFTKRQLGRQQLHVQRGDVCGAVRHNFITVRNKRNYGEL
jgi:hypothetical protein